MTFNYRTAAVNCESVCGGKNFFGLKFSSINQYWIAISKIKDFRTQIYIKNFISPKNIFLHKKSALRRLETEIFVIKTNHCEFLFLIKTVPARHLLPDIQATNRGLYDIL